MVTGSLTRVASFIAGAPGLRLAEAVRTSVFTDDQEAAIAIRPHEDLTASHVQQEIALFTRGHSRRLYIISN